MAISLRDLHNNGAAHLEVSPNSIVVDTNGAVLNPATLNESNRYTSGYTAPEIYKGVSAGNLSDIYSFCAVLFFVATGHQPINSLSRTGVEYEQDEESQIDASFLEIIKSGTALEAADRIPSVQEIIIKLSAYNTHPFVNDVLPNEQPTSEEKPKKKRRNPIVIILISVAILAIALLGTYFGCYIGAKNNARNRDFSSADKFLILSVVTELHDPDLVAYIDAGQLLENREYAKSAEAFDALGDYEDAEELTNESNYRLALQYADKNDFSKSITLLEKLNKSGHGDSREKIKEVQYRWAWSLIDDEKYIDAYKKLKNLGNYSDAKETLEVLTELIYVEAQALYSEQEYTEAANLFNHISPYADSKKYLVLIDARGSYAWRNPKETAEKLADIFYFEDAAELLVSSTDVACYFLLGKWTTSGGSYYFEMELRDDGEHSFWNSYNLPWYDGSFTIEDGVYSVSNDSYEDKPQYRITLLSPDCMEIYCYKNGSTYTLYR